MCTENEKQLIDTQGNRMKKIEKYVIIDKEEMKPLKWRKSVMKKYFEEIEDSHGKSSTILWK